MDLQTWCCSLPTPSPIACRVPSCVLQFLVFRCTSPPPHKEPHNTKHFQRQSAEYNICSIVNVFNPWRKEIISFSPLLLDVGTQILHHRKNRSHQRHWKTFRGFRGAQRPLPSGVPVREVNHVILGCHHLAYLDSRMVQYPSSKEGLTGAAQATTTDSVILYDLVPFFSFFLVAYISSPTAIYCEIHGNEDLFPSKNGCAKCLMILCPISQ